MHLEENCQSKSHQTHVHFDHALTQVQVLVFDLVHLLELAVVHFFVEPVHFDSVHFLEQLLTFLYLSISYLFLCPFLNVSYFFSS